MISPKKTSPRRTPSPVQRGNGIWLHPDVGRNSPFHVPHTQYGMLVQKLQPYLDQILSFEKKKSKQAPSSNQRKPSWGGPQFKKQRTASSPHLRTMRSPAPRIKKPRTAKQTVPPPTKVPRIQRSDDSLPVLQQREVTESAPTSPQPDQTAIPHNNPNKTMSLEIENIPSYTFGPPQEYLQSYTKNTDPLETEDFELASSDPSEDCVHSDSEDTAAPLETDFGPVSSDPPEDYVQSDSENTDPLETDVFEPVSSDTPEVHVHIDRNTASPASLPSPIPRTTAILKHKPVIYPRIPYTEQQNETYALVSLLEEIWDVDWEHPLSIKWGQKWSELRCEIDVKVKEIRHNQSGSILWVSGDFLLTRIGTSENDNKLLHETLTIPFTTTILHPSMDKSYAETLRPDDLPPYHEKLWTETGDWKASLIANPLKNEPSETGEYDGFIHVTGRIWWFRKQLLPFNGAKQL